MTFFLNCQQFISQFIILLSNNTVFLFWTISIFQQGGNKGEASTKLKEAFILRVMPVSCVNQHLQPIDNLNVLATNSTLLEPLFQ